MNKLPTWSLLLIFPVFLFGQNQISNIEYLDQRIDHPIKGFLSYEGKEYFVERGLEETIISLITEDSLQLLHTLTDKPDYQYYGGIINNYKHSNSGIIHEGPLLYELYSNYIYISNILTGETEQIIDLKKFDVSIRSEFTITDDYYIFKGHLSPPGAQTYLRYDRTNDLIKNIDFNLDSPTYRIGFKLFKLNEFNDGLIVYNILNDHIDTLSLPSSNTYKIESIQLDRVNNNLLIRSIDSSVYYTIDEDLEIKQLSCLSNIPFEKISIQNKHLVYSIRENEVEKVIVIDIGNCELLADFILPPNVLAENLFFWNSTDLEQEYLLFSQLSDWSGIGFHFIYDFEEKSFTQLNLSTDFLVVDRLVRYENSIYLLVVDNIHFLGGLYEIYELDLNSKVVYKLDDYPKENIQSVVIGEAQEDQELNIYYQIGTNSFFEADPVNTLQSFDHKDKTLDTIREFDYLNNLGISNMRNEFWYEDKYIFWCKNAIYALQNDQTIKIIDAQDHPAFHVRDDKLTSIIRQDSVSIKVEIDLSDLSYKTMGLGSTKYLHQIALDNVILCTKVKEEHEVKGYYDLRTDTFKGYTLENQQYEPFQVYASGNNVLMYDFLDHESIWYIFDTELEEGYHTELADLFNSYLYPDGLGGGYLNPSSFNDTLYHLTSQGKLDLISSKFDYRIFNQSQRNAASTKTLIFDGEDDIAIIVIKDQGRKIYKIPANNMSSSVSFFWKQIGSTSYIQIRNDSGYDLYQYSFENEPKKLNTHSQEKEIMDIFEETNKLVLISYDYDNNQVTFEDFDYVTQEFITRKSFPNQPSANYSLNHKTGRITEYTYVVTLEDGLHGYEPWIYNSETSEIRILKDIKPGYLRSFAQDFTTIPNGKGAYFTAITTTNDRQFFKIDQTVSNSKDISSHIESIKISPSPATDFIQLNQDFKNLALFDSSGKVLLRLEDYKTDEFLNLGNFVSGLYYIHAIDKTDTLHIGKFVVQ